MAARPKFTQVDDWIAAAPEAHRALLETVRSLARAAVPEATECISYQMPALRLRKVFFFYATFKNHLGIYPPVRGDADLEAELAPYRGPKGNLQFPHNRPIPLPLLRRVVLAQAAEHCG
jgi:uncharacterized protein YdhG (YjbR/CyaY superfamily)